MNFFERLSNLKLYQKHYISLLKQLETRLENYENVPNKELDPYYVQTLFHYMHIKETVKEIKEMISKVIY